MEDVVQYNDNDDDDEIMSMMLMMRTMKMMKIMMIIDRWIVRKIDHLHVVRFFFKLTLSALLLWTKKIIIDLTTFKFVLSF